MSDKERIEISDFGDWRLWVYSGKGQEAFRWRDDNRDAWMLLWFTFAYGDEKALKLYDIYSNAPSKSEHFDRAFNDYCRVLDRAKELLEEQIAEQARNTLESGSNGKNSELSGVGVRDIGDQGGGNGKTIEC